MRDQVPQRVAPRGRGPAAFPLEDYMPIPTDQPPVPLERPGRHAAELAPDALNLRAQAWRAQARAVRVQSTRDWVTRRLTLLGV